MKKIDIKFYDSKDKTLKILNEEIINIYVCGPTTYDYLHLGNLRPIIFFDLVVRFLEINQKKVKYVMNITDIDDKIIESYENNNSLKFNSELELSNFYSDHFLKLFSIFNLRLPNNFPKVSTSISKIEDFLIKLENKNLTYLNSQNDLIFKISKIDDYGILGNRSSVNNISRLDSHKNKENQEDFVLWKKTLKGIKFSSKWSQGRPGWHSECACFIYDNFDQKPITIHGGGIDLKFPHHENERAQFKGLTGQELAKIYAYVGHVNYDQIKLSKSLSNAKSINDLLLEFSSNTIKLIILFSNYKKPLEFGEDLIKQTIIFENKISSLINNLKKINKDKITFLNNQLFTFDEQGVYLSDFTELLADDFSMQNAQSLFNSLIKEINKDLRNNSLNWKNISDFFMIIKILNLFFN